jgi:predicted regulator of Ras-like GTPase activity (Roadblock/LC7/MglB family)
MISGELKQVDSDGFEGAFSGLMLSDVIQLNGHNRFTGCISIEYGNHHGLIYFRDGEIIHAEDGDVSGEDAFYSIITWPGGKFQLQPKITTTSYTIRQSLNYLLLEAHRLMDEKRAQDEKMEKSKADAGTDNKSSNTELFQKIPGVEHALLLTRSGVPVADDSFEAEGFAAQSIYLATFGNQLGGIFGVGEVKSAAIQSKQKHLLLFDTNGQYLSVSISGGRPLGAVEVEIRKMMTENN